MTIELFWPVVAGLSLIAYVLIKDWVKVVSKYRVERKGRNWVVRDSKGRFVRITPNFFDVLSLGVENEY